jgi:predicted ATPase
MRLTHVRAKNFKSFQELDIRLDDFNVLIGANASGKSNFIQLFTFVRDIVESGLENAVSIQGGAKYLRNINCASDDPLTIELQVEPSAVDQIVPFLTEDAPSRVKSLKYEFSLALPNGRGARLAEESLWVERLSKGPSSPSLGFLIKRTGDMYEIEGDLDPFAKYLEGWLNSQQDRRFVLLIENEMVRSMLGLRGLRSIAAYDVDPKAPKTAVLFGAKSELEPDAHNLAIVLDRILSDEDDRRKLLNLLKDILPFAEELRTEPLRDSSLFFNLRETFSCQEMPASLLSDGTIDIIAMLAILYFEPKSFVVIEEPDRNLHSSMMSKLVAMFQDASRVKQIVLSTHNPEIVRHVEPGQLILMSRDAAGFSHASRPADRAQIQQFLSDEISMDELYIQNLLEV